MEQSSPQITLPSLANGSRSGVVYVVVQNPSQSLNIAETLNRGGLAQLGEYQVLTELPPSIQLHPHQTQFLQNLPPQQTAQTLPIQPIHLPNFHSVTTPNNTTTGSHVYFCFEDCKYDNPEHPNKIFIPKYNPTVRDFASFIKQIFGISQPLSIKFKGSNELLLIESENSINEIPVNDRRNLIFISKVSVGVKRYEPHVLNGERDVTGIITKKSRTQKKIKFKDIDVIVNHPKTPVNFGSIVFCKDANTQGIVVDRNGKATIEYEIETGKKRVGSLSKFYRDVTGQTLQEKGESWNNICFVSPGAQGPPFEARHVKTLEDIKYIVKGPKKPISAFLWFCTEQRSQSRDSSTLDFSKQAGEIWKGLTEEQKQVYRTKEAKDKMRFLREKEEWETLYGEQELHEANPTSIVNEIDSDTSVEDHDDPAPLITINDDSMDPDGIDTQGFLDNHLDHQHDEDVEVSYSIDDSHDISVENNTQPLLSNLIHHFGSHSPEDEHSSTEHYSLLPPMLNINADIHKEDDIFRNT